jgi:basic amino acid/polyamine antiporter, APA family
MTPHKRPQLLGFWMCVAWVVGISIGSGVFLLPAPLAPYGLNCVVAWGFTGCEAVRWGGVLLLLGAPLYFLVRNDVRRLA